MKTIYTIGHSTLTIDDFYNRLHNNQITCVVDVRSTPYSKYNPQFDKEELKKYLLTKNIKYIHMAKEFGARREEEEFYDKDNKVIFAEVEKSEIFQSGIERIKKGVENYQICLMCSENEPLECHRFSLISMNLIKNDLQVIHILKNGETKTHQELEDKYLKDNTKQDLLSINAPISFMDVYPKLAKDVAYQKK